MHFKRANLHFKGDTLSSYYGSMKGLVHVGLGGGDIVLEAERYGSEHIVNYSQDVIAFHNGVHDYSYRVNVINFLDILALYIYFFINAVNALNSALDDWRRLNVGYPFSNAFFYGFYKAFAFVLFGGQSVFHLFIAVGVEVVKRHVLHFLLNVVHTQSMGYGSVKAHGFKRGFSLFFGRTAGQGAHIVQSVRKLYDNNAYILAHRHKYFADIFGVLLFLCVQGNLTYFGNAVHQQRHVFPEFFLQSIEGGAGIFHNVVEQRRADSVGIHTHFQQNISYRHRVTYIRLSACAGLSLVGVFRKLVCGKDFFQIILLFAAFYSAG